MKRQSIEESEYDCIMDLMTPERIELFKNTYNSEHAYFKLTNKSAEILLKAKLRRDHVMLMNQYYKKSINGEL